MKRQFLLILLALSLASFQMYLKPTAAQAQEPVRVELGKKADLLNDGSAVHLPVTVTCDPNAGQLLEALVYVVQDGNTSQFAGIPVTCENQPHTVIVTVRAFEEAPFHKGKANATAYVLLYDEATGETTEGGDTGKIKIK